MIVSEFDSHWMPTTFRIRAKFKSLEIFAR